MASYSEIHKQIEKEGYKETFQLASLEYVTATNEITLLEQKLNAAKCKQGSAINSIYHLALVAYRDGERVKNIGGGKFQIVYLQQDGMVCIIDVGENYFDLKTFHLSNINDKKK